MFTLSAAETEMLNALVSKEKLTPVKESDDARFKKDCGSSCSGHCGETCQAACKSTCTSLF